jgi:single-strand DNA-binding protein
MSGVNKIILVGNLGKDPTVRTGQSGTAFSNFSLAVSEKRGGADQTEWFSCVAFGKVADVAGKYLKKGRQVYCEGRVQSRQYKDKDSGQDRRITEVVVENLRLLGDGGRREERPTGPALDEDWTPPPLPKTPANPSPAPEPGDMPW